MDFLFVEVNYCFCARFFMAMLYPFFPVEFSACFVGAFGITEEEERGDGEVDVVVVSWRPQQSLSCFFLSNSGCSQSAADLAQDCCCQQQRSMIGISRLCKPACGETVGRSQ